ncbi:type II toxin-antitoxin system RelE/ParE family toxin [Candidatus Kaiserbacteria bacterium]|nr:type II toxin-antitoxin system RelE/ParE family toxin [Candidatus Kaiserbacteria bacterium]
MALKTRLSPRAARDLVDIRAYIIKESPQGAESVRRAIERCVDAIGEFPGYGQETSNDRVRVMPVSSYPYLVYFAIENGTVVVVHVRHSSRMPPRTREL